MECNEPNYFENYLIQINANAECRSFYHNLLFIVIDICMSIFVLFFIAPYFFIISICINLLCSKIILVHTLHDHVSMLNDFPYMI